MNQPLLEGSFGFDEFWKLYPLKVGKRHAERAFTRALKRATYSAIIDGVRRYTNDPNLPEKQYIPYPATWLNRDGWDDEPLPPRTRRETNTERIARVLKEMRDDH